MGCNIMTSTEFVKMVNNFAERIGATIFRFCADTDGRIAMISTIFYSVHWNSIDNLLRGQEEKPSTYSLFTICECAARNIRSTASFLDSNTEVMYGTQRMSISNIKFLEIISSCNSLEELQIKTDLYV